MGHIADEWQGRLSSVLAAQASCICWVGVLAVRPCWAGRATLPTVLFIVWQPAADLSASGIQVCSGLACSSKRFSFACAAESADGAQPAACSTAGKQVVWSSCLMLCRMCQHVYYGRRCTKSLLAWPRKMQQPAHLQGYCTFLLNGSQLHVQSGKRRT